MKKSNIIISVVIVVALIIIGVWLETTKDQNNDINILQNGETYNDAPANFSFNYSKDYSVKEIPAPAEDEARTILLSKEEQAPSIQIAILPFDEDIVLTTERIKNDVPDLIMKNPQEISIGSITKGVKFESELGINVWFVAKNNLFQITAFKDETSVVDGLISSFKI